MSTPSTVILKASAATVRGSDCGTSHDGRAWPHRLLTQPLIRPARFGPCLASALLLVIFSNVILPCPGTGASSLPEILYQSPCCPQNCTELWWTTRFCTLEAGPVRLCLFLPFHQDELLGSFFTGPNGKFVVNDGSRRHEVFSNHTSQVLPDYRLRRKGKCSRIVPAFSAFRIDVSFTVK